MSGLDDLDPCLDVFDSSGRKLSVAIHSAQQVERNYRARSKLGLPRR